MIPPILDTPTPTAKIKRPLPQDGPICLNLGGRDTKIPGFVVVDKNPGDNTDIEGDVSDLSMFSDGTVETIYASNILEHFSHRRTRSVLNEWCRVLKKGGKAYISVPDFDALVDIYKKVGMRQWVIDFGWGGQEYDEAYHFAPFTYGYLAGCLAESGFRDIKRLKEMPFGLADCSTLTSNITGKCVVINVEAIK